MAKIKFNLTATTATASGAVSVNPAAAGIQLRTGDVLEFTRGVATTQPIRVELSRGLQNLPRLSCVFPSLPDGGFGPAGGVKDHNFTLRGLPVLDGGGRIIVAFTDAGEATGFSPQANMTFTVGVVAGTVQIDPGDATNLRSREFVTFLPKPGQSPAPTIRAELLNGDEKFVLFSVDGVPNQRIDMVVRSTLDGGNIIVTFSDSPGGNGATGHFP